MEKLLELLSELHDDVDYENEECLIDDGILDSLDIHRLNAGKIVDFAIFKGDGTGAVVRDNTACKCCNLRLFAPIFVVSCENHLVIWLIFCENNVIFNHVPTVFIPNVQMNGVVYRYIIVDVSAKALT